MTRRGIFWALCIGSLAACGGGGGNHDTHDPDLDRMVETAWTGYTQTLPSAAGGLALYVDTPEAGFFASSGIAEASPDTHFRVASNTKPFTAAAVLLLQQEGKLSIDDPITGAIPGTTTPYLPETSDYDIPHKSEITIKQLLAHRAGVYDLGNDPVPASCPAPYAGRYYPLYVMDADPLHTFTADELAGVVAHCRLSYFPPDRDYHYSDTGYTLLGKIIERVSGLSYADFIRERLLIPNELFDTSVPVLGSDGGIPAPFAPGSTLRDGVLRECTASNVSLNVAEGNIISTPRNLARWMRRLFRGEAGLRKETVAAMTECISPQGGNSCYGLGLLESLQPLVLYGHTGAHDGYLSLGLYDPKNDIATVVFASLSNFDAVADELALLVGVREEAYRILGYR